MPCENLFGGLSIVMALQLISKPNSIESIDEILWG